MHALAVLVHVLMVVLTVVIIGGGAAVVYFRAHLRRIRQGTPARPGLLARTMRPGRVLPKQRLAIEQPGGLHVYLHGVTAEDVAEIIRRQQGQS
jgi:hypothetical protein